MRGDLFRAALNCEMTTMLAADRNKKLWMKVNPALGTIVYVVMQSGRDICETLSLEKAINAYNDLREVAA